MRIKHLDSDGCTVTIRHRWLVQNPFRSMFWAVMGMGAEMSTGALLLYLTSINQNPYRFILVSQEGRFQAKARGRISFACQDGEEIAQLLVNLQPAQSVPITLSAEARNGNDDLLATFTFTWQVEHVGD